MRYLSCLFVSVVTLFGCGDGGGSTTSSGGGGAGTTSTDTGGSGGATTSTTEGGGGSGGATTSTTEGGGGSGGSTTSSSTTTTDTGGTQAEGQPCGQSAEGATCKSGLVCCYPCGIEGCDFTCTVPCESGSPGCSDDGCLLLP